MNGSSDFWDAMAEHHASLENNYLDLPSIRLVLHDLQEPVLVVGAGQGLIVAELRSNGFETHGVDLSPEMIRYAKTRRGLDLVHADARAMPFREQSYETIIYATGVIDFIGDEEQIVLILKEARRIIRPSGKVFVAFYKLSVASEQLMTQIGLLKDNVLSLRESLEIYRLSPVQSIAWVAKKAGVGHFRALMLLLGCLARSPIKEKILSFHMQKIVRKGGSAGSFINTAPEKQPYRNEPEIRNLFNRLAIPIRKVQASNSCWLVQI